MQAQGVFLGSAAPEAHERVEFVALVGFDNGRSHVEDPAAHRHAMWLVPARPQNRAPEREDAGKLLAVEFDRLVLDEPAETVAETRQTHAEAVLGCAPHRAQRGIQPGTIAAAGEKTQMKTHDAMLNARSPRAESKHESIRENRSPDRTQDRGRIHRTSESANLRRSTGFVR